MAITKDDIVHVAELARLHLDEPALELYARQLRDILAYVETLNGIDTEGVPSTSHAIFINNAFREDKVKPSMPSKQALENAPHEEEGDFVVPKVIG